MKIPILLILIPIFFLYADLSAQISADSLESVINSKINNNEIDNRLVEDLRSFITLKRFDDWEKAYKYSDILENLTSDNGNFSNWTKGLALKFKGNLYLDKSEYESALAMYYNAIEFYSINEDSLNIADMYSYIAYIYYNLSDFVTAQRLYENALRINATFKDKFYKNGYVNNLLMLASIAIKESRFSKAEALSESAKETSKELNDTIMVVRSYLHIVQAQIGLGKYEEAKTNAGDALQALSKIRLPRKRDIVNEYQVLLLNVLGNVEKQDGNLTEAYNNYIKAQNLSDGISNYSVAATIEVSLANIEYLLGMTEKSIKRLQLVLNNRDFENIYDSKISSSSLLSNIYGDMKSYEKAFHYKTLADELKDSLYSTKVYSDLNNLRAIYEYGQQKKENELLKYKVDTEQNQKYTVVGFLIVLILLAVLLLFRHLKIVGLNKQLQFYNNEKKTLIKILAHDLKNPFSNFLSSIDLLNFEFNSIDNDMKKNIVSNLNNSAHKYHSLLENILIWISTDSEGYNVVKEKVNLFNLVEEIIQIYKPTIDDKGIDLILNINKNYILDTDKNILSAIVRNIINNSVKFTGKNGEIIISALQEEGKNKIVISDNGKGMNKEILENLFNGVSQKNSDQDHGLGFGMQIIGEMLQKINAEIEVKSKEGKGTLIVIKI